MTTLIKNVTVVSDGKSLKTNVLIEDGFFVNVDADNEALPSDVDETLDAEGCFLLPGIIDDHVHFRQPGLTQKADMASESRAAAAGGVTTFFDMPNTVPQTTSLEALEEKFAIAATDSIVNYSFFFGATNDNADLFARLDPHRIPGIKLFMGASTGNMLVDRRQSLDRIFSTATMPVMTHCEDTAMINSNMAEAKRLYGDDPDVTHHPDIRSREACIECTRLAVELARQHHTRLHVAHISTKEELQLFEPHDDNITAEAVVAHLMFSAEDYITKGTRIKCNPAVKTADDREALRQAIADGRISVIGTDHAPHLLADKHGGCAKAASGMPSIQYSLCSMLELVDKGYISMTRLVELMCHNPARIFGVSCRGYIRPGYKADCVLVRKGTPWTVTDGDVLSKCGWTPLTGHQFSWRVERTICNGKTIYADGKIQDTTAGEAVRFRE